MEIEKIEGSEINNETILTTVQSMGKTLQFIKTFDGLIIDVVFKGEKITSLTKAQADALKEWL